MLLTLHFHRQQLLPTTCQINCHSCWQQFSEGICYFNSILCEMVSDKYVVLQSNSHLRTSKLLRTKLRSALFEHEQLGHLCLFREPINHVQAYKLPNYNIVFNIFTLLISPDRFCSFFGTELNDFKIRKFLVKGYF